MKENLSDSYDDLSDLEQNEDANETITQFGHARSYSVGQSFETVCCSELMRSPNMKGKLVEIASYFDIKNENLRQGIIRLFKKLMKKIWVKAKKLKKEKRCYATEFLKFEKKILEMDDSESGSKRIQLRNLIKFEFDRILDLFEIYEIPNNAFDRHFSIDGHVSSSCNSKYVRKFFSCPGIKAIFDRFHNIARETKIYLTIRPLKNREFKEMDREKLIEYCESFSLVDN